MSPPELGSRRLSGHLTFASFRERPECRECGEPWRWPRNIAHMSLIADVDKSIKPTTKSTVVAYVRALPGTDPPQPVMHENVFRNLELVTKSGGCLGKSVIKLVEEFQYDTATGRVYYESESPPPGACTEFGLLITLTSWYKQLFRSLCNVSLSIMDHHANVLLIAAMIFGSEEIWEDFYLSKYIFAFAWTLMLLSSFVVAFRAARVEWDLKACRSVGDLSAMSAWFDDLHAFLALVFFHFFMVDDHVKNIVIQLHPWKSVQPFAAVKIDGTRAFIIGYENRPLYMVSARAGTFHNMMSLQVLKSVVFFFKAYVAFWLATGYAGRPPSYPLVAACLSSVGSMCYGWQDAVQLFYYRRILKRQLQETVEKGKRRCGNEACNAKRCENCSEMQRRRWDAAKKLLMQEYNERHKLSRNSFAGDECDVCGRNKDRQQCAHKRPTPMEGETVQLGDDHRSFHDAKFGCMRNMEDGETGHRILTTGQVVRVVKPPAAGSHARCLVEIRGNEILKEQHFEHVFYWTKTGVQWARTLKRRRKSVKRQTSGGQTGKVAEVDQEVRLFDTPIIENSQVTPEHFAALQTLAKTQPVRDPQSALAAQYMEVGVRWWYDERALRVVDDADISDAVQGDASISCKSGGARAQVAVTGATPTTVGSGLTDSNFQDSQPLRAAASPGMVDMEAGELLVDPDYQRSAAGAGTASAAPCLDLALQASSSGWQYHWDTRARKLGYCYYDHKEDKWEIHSDANSILRDSMGSSSSPRLLE